jgi:predicted nucleic acid-binding protein
VLIDTDVLIWYLRGNINAQDVVHNNIPFKISVINYMELVQGMKSKQELKLLQKHLRKWTVEIIQIDENISTHAMFLIEDYFLSHSLELSDAIIASTSLERQEEILTANDKHYKFIPNIQIKKFRPSYKRQKRRRSVGAFLSRGPYRVGGPEAAPEYRQNTSYVEPARMPYPQSGAHPPFPANSAYKFRNRFLSRRTA